MDLKLGFKVGDRVRVKTKKELKEAGLSYDDWDSEYYYCIGEIGTIISFESNHYCKIIFDKKELNSTTILMKSDWDTRCDIVKCFSTFSIE